MWGDKFGFDDVRKLLNGAKRNLKQPHRFVVFTNLNPRPLLNEHGDGFVCSVAPISDESLTMRPGCFARLRMFNPIWQAKNGITDRLVCIDLDTVITGPLDPLFDRPEPFVIMRGGNSANPCPYNGALMMLRVGAYPEVWTDFSLEAAASVPFYEFPDDQGWLWHKIPNAPATWKCGRGSGVYVWHKPGWPGWKKTKEILTDEMLPEGTRLVTFSGWRSPERFKHIGWIKKHWRV